MTDRRPTRIDPAVTIADRDIVVCDPFHLVPDTAVLPPGVALMRQSEGAASVDAKQLGQFSQ